MEVGRRPKLEFWGYLSFQQTLIKIPKDRRIDRVNIKNDIALFFGVYVAGRV